MGTLREYTHAHARLSVQRCSAVGCACERAPAHVRAPFSSIGRGAELGGVERDVHERAVGRHADKVQAVRGPREVHHVLQR